MASETTTVKGSVNPEAREASGELIRAMAMVYNLCLSYGAEHPVVTRLASEQIGKFADYASAYGDFTVFFIHGRAWWEAVALEDDNLMVSRLAQFFAGKGVSGLTVAPGLEAAELRRFFSCMIRGGNRIFDTGLQALLDEAGIQNIRERKEKVVIVGQAPKIIPMAKSPQDTGISPVGTEEPVTVSQDEESGADAGEAGEAARGGGRGYAVGGGGPKKAWDLEIEEEGSGELEEEAKPQETPLRSVVRMTADSVLLRRLSPAAAAEMLTREFEMRERKALEEAERSVRLLTKMRDALLGEMERRGIAVMVADARMNILAVNPSARAVLGSAAVVELGSPLHDFISGGRGVDKLVLGDGRPHLARKETYAVEGMDDGGIVLVVLDPVR